MLPSKFIGSCHERKLSIGSCCKRKLPIGSCRERKLPIGSCHDRKLLLAPVMKGSFLLGAVMKGSFLLAPAMKGSFLGIGSCCERKPPIGSCHERKLPFGSVRERKLSIGSCCERKLPIGVCHKRKPPISSLRHLWNFLIGSCTVYMELPIDAVLETCINIPCEAEKKTYKWAYSYPEIFLSSYSWIYIKGNLFIFSWLFFPHTHVITILLYVVLDVFPVRGSNRGPLGGCKVFFILLVFFSRIRAFCLPPSPHPGPSCKFMSAGSPAG